MRRKLLLAITVLSTSVVGCSSTGTLKSNQEAVVTQLDDNYQPLETLGPTPLVIPTSAAVERFKVTPKNGNPEFLIVLFPDNIDGDLSIEAPVRAITGSSALAQRDYLDMLLRTHRLVLQRRLDEAKRLIAKMNDSYDVTYGALMLAGNVATLEGKLMEAQEHYQLAKSLYLEDPPVKTQAR